MVYVVPTELLENLSEDQTIEYDGYNWAVLPQLIKSRKVMRQIGIITTPTARSGAFTSEFGINKGYDCVFIKDAEDMTCEDTPAPAKVELAILQADIGWLESSGEAHSDEGSERYEKAQKRVAELLAEHPDTDMYSD